MPKVNSFEKKENEVREWILVGLIYTGIRTQKELAKRINMPLSTWRSRYANPETFRLDEIWALERIIGGKRE